MYTLHNVRRVMLSLGGMRSLTNAMLMRPVTLPKQEPWQARIGRTCDPPWFVDELTVILAPRSLEPVHATVKISELKLMFVEEANNTWGLPIMASPGPLNEDSSAYAQSVLCGDFK